MKFFAIFLLSSLMFTVTAQTADTVIQSKNTLDDINIDNYNKWSVSVGFGGHDGMVPVRTTSDISFQIPHFGLEGRYMFNNRFGVKLDFGYDAMNFKSVSTRSHYWRTSIQGVVNLRDVLRFDTWTDRFGLLFHTGAGVSHLWLAKSLSSEDMDLTFLDGLDDMINYTFGITPQVKITERFSVKSDLTFTCHTRQSTYWDRLSTEGHELDHGQINGYFFNFSIGASFYFGKNKRHADWTPTEYGVLPDNSAMTDRITQLELKDKLQDDDGDGVVNGRDEEPNSVPGSVVNSKGVALLDSDGDGVMDFRDEESNTIPGSVVNSKGVALVDTDKDGIEDRFDVCPNIAGLFSKNGCPEKINELPLDTDKDGILDKDDKCPYIAGPIDNIGCPYQDTDGDGVLDKDDNCPSVAGTISNAGCPEIIEELPLDTDQDGILDKDDKCPYIAGPIDNIGCPYQDTDGDGVLDKDDNCPSVAGTISNAGCPEIIEELSLDTDKDGILDKYDKCPYIAGPIVNIGCPYEDTDKDGVIDKDDNCPSIFGSVKNAGCPEIDEEVQKILNYALRGVKFQTSKSIILTKSYVFLDNIINILNDYPTYFLQIDGHTDNVGNEESNLRLSKARAKACFDYFVKRGIAPSRLSSAGYGESKPSFSNDTPAGRAENRRVEFRVVFE